MDWKSQVTTKTQDMAPLIIVYSIPDLGKSTFLAQMVKDVPESLLFQCGEPSLANLLEEDKQGVPHLPDILGGGSNTADKIEGYYDFGRKLTDLKNEEKPSFKLLSFDNLDNIINTNITEFVIDRYFEGDRGKASGWGNNKVINIAEEVDVMMGCFTELRKKGVTIVLSFHARVIPCKDPLGEEYDVYAFNLPANKRCSIREQFVNYATQIMFGTQNVTTKKTKSGSKKAVNSQRVLMCAPHPAYEVKNKFNLPDVISFDYKTFKEQMKPKK